MQAFSYGVQMISAWWAGDIQPSQVYGPTDFTPEPPGHGVAHWHAGIDFPMDIGTPLYAPVQCRLARIGERGYGDSAPELDIKHGVHILLGHMDSLTSRDDGHIFARDELIGYSGDKGASFGSHVHFEARTAPWRYLQLDHDPARWLVPPQEDDTMGPETLIYPSGIELWRCNAGRLQHSYQTADTANGWSPWLTIEGGPVQGPPTARFNPTDGHPEVWAFAPDGVTVLHTYRDAHGVWSALAPI
jgi:murein DD-endopeptidase MepM/ murein hydrolase activator NlpD